ncbi:hypothetical protein [Streptomyces jumonjinensis]|uniref:hypothetical protein n=1 Tax=Streptomyces jumonjinensis TaxID=1945 RepID=UPI0037B7DCB6
MGRGAQSLARVAVVVRAGAAPLFVLGLLSAAVGTLPPGLTGRRIGLLTGAALFLIAAAATALVRRGRYLRFEAAATRAGRADFLQDRKVTLRTRRRARRLPLVLAPLAAIGTSFVMPAAGGLLLAGVGAGLWAKAVWLGHRERVAETLFWVRADRAAAGPVAGQVEGFSTTGIAAGDAAPGGARRR